MLVHAPDVPAGHFVGAEGFIKLLRGCVPIEHGPFHAATASGAGDRGEFDEDGLADSEATSIGADVEVFEVEADGARPGGEVHVVDGGGLRHSVDFADQGLGARASAEAGAEEVLAEGGFIRVHGVGLALVGG